MILPIQITFRNMEPSKAIEAWIQEEAQKLEEFFHRIMSCRVVVELASRKRGGPYQVRIDLTVPGKELVVNRQPSVRGPVRQIPEPRIAKHLEVQTPHKDVRQAVDDAFKEMSRQLQDYARRLRRDVKTHEPSPRAKITKLFPEQGYGFIETTGGREIYFHKNSVLDDAFGRLKIGAAVKYAEEIGDKGPQASTVKLLRNHRPGQAEEVAVAKVGERSRR